MGEKEAPAQPAGGRPVGKGVKKALPVVALTALVSGLVALAFRSGDPWVGMLGAMSVALVAALGMRPRVKPTVARVAIGLGSASVLIVLTHAALALVPALRPEVAFLYRWKAGHSTLFLAATLCVIVAGEELFWRGVVTRFAAERLGRAGGVVVGALLCAAAHAASMNVLLTAAAFGMGVVWGALAEATEDLTAPVVCHLAWDAVVMLIWPVG
jgi:membrane protease YdiL (CAAX protease family)